MNLLVLAGLGFFLFHIYIYIYIYIYIMNLPILNSLIKECLRVGCLFVRWSSSGFSLLFYSLFFLYIKDLTKHLVYNNMYSLNVKQVSIKVIT